MLKFIKKLLKYILILAIIAAVIGSAIGIGVYYWEQNEDKKEQWFNQMATETNLAYFTTDDFFVPEKYKGIKWESTQNPPAPQLGGLAIGEAWKRGEFQKGFAKDGALIYRHVPFQPKVAYYYYSEKEDEEGRLGVDIHWIQSCKPNSEVTYKIGEKNKTSFKLSCDEQGGHLSTSMVKPDFDFATDRLNLKLNAGGFTYSIDSGYFNMNSLLKNKTMLQVGKEVEAPVLIEFTD